MNSPRPDPPELADPAADTLSDVPFGPTQHLQLALYGAIAQIVDAGGEDPASAVQAQPFLAEYIAEFTRRLGPVTRLAPAWHVALRAWEARAQAAGAWLPLRGLARQGLAPLARELWLAAGLVEEDPRFGDLFAQAQDGERRPTHGLLASWWATNDAGFDQADAVRQALQSLVGGGLLQAGNLAAPRPRWTLAVALPPWDALRLDLASLPWLAHHPIASLPTLETCILPPGVRARCETLPSLLAVRPAPLLLLCGPAHNGRTTLAGAIARASGHALLVADHGVCDDAARWPVFGAVAAMLDAMPLLVGELPPGTHAAPPPLPWCDTALALVGTREGRWLDDRAVLRVDLPLPDAAERLAHWQAALPAPAPTWLPALAQQRRLASGHIRRAAADALALATMSGGGELAPEHVAQACAQLPAHALETLATPLPAAGAWHELAVDDPTREELDALLARCRWRETLAGRPGPGSAGPGVRALFTGASGTGKTLAARLLAAELGKPLYRVDLAATVDKYLGETEKNLHRAFSAAESLDVVLLLDEGDALMAGRTDVSSSNDRYANLETNFLLQRIEHYDGILLITSNAAERIDKAFARRMDVVIPFRAPDEWRRYEILKLHLVDDAVDDGWLQQMACRCPLSGGQLRNVVGHARLLALQDGAALDTQHLFSALRREYRKTGAACPLRAA